MPDQHNNLHYDEFGPKRYPIRVILLSGITIIYGATSISGLLVAIYGISGLAFGARSIWQLLVVSCGRKETSGGPQLHVEW